MKSKSQVLYSRSDGYFGERTKCSHFFTLKSKSQVLFIMKSEVMGILGGELNAVLMSLDLLCRRCGKEMIEVIV